MGHGMLAKIRGQVGDPESIVAMSRQRLLWHPLLDSARRASRSSVKHRGVEFHGEAQKRVYCIHSFGCFAKSGYKRLGKIPGAQSKCAAGKAAHRADVIGMAREHVAQAVDCLSDRAERFEGMGFVELREKSGGVELERSFVARQRFRVPSEPVQHAALQIDDLGVFRKSHPRTLADLERVATRTKPVHFLRNLTRQCGIIGFLPKGGEQQPHRVAHLPTIRFQHAEPQQSCRVVRVDGECLRIRAARFVRLIQTDSRGREIDCYICLLRVQSERTFE